MYTESFIRKCDVTPAYYNFVRNHISSSGCSTHSDRTVSRYNNSDTHSDHHSESATCYDSSGHHEGGSCSDHHNDYSSCSDSTYYSHTDTGYDNHSNYSNCNVKWNYGNYADAENPSTGVPINLSWSFDSDNFPQMVKESIGKMDELVANIDRLLKEKGRNEVPDSTLDDGKTVGEGKVNKSQIDSILDSINSLKENLTGSSSTLDNSEWLKESDIIAIKDSVDSLARTSLSYANYVDFTSYTETGTKLPTAEIPSNSISGSVTGGTYKDNTEVRYR